MEFSRAGTTVLRNGDQHRLSAPRFLHSSRDLGGVVSRETGVAELRGVSPGSPQHSLERQIAETVHAQMPADLLDAMTRADQLVLRGRVDPVVARSRNRR